MRDKKRGLYELGKGLSLGHLVEGIFVTAFIYQRLELAALDFQELTRLAKFDDVSGIKDHLHKSVNMR